MNAPLGRFLLFDEYDDWLVVKDDETSNTLGERCSRDVFRENDESRVTQIGVNYIGYEQCEVYASHQQDGKGPCDSSGLPSAYQISTPNLRRAK